MFEGSNEPRIEILNCHQSLLHGKSVKFIVDFYFLYFCLYAREVKLVFSDDENMPIFLGGHSIGTMAMEAEYTLPQHTSNMNAMPQEDHRRIAPEPYASSAIYTELNYQVFIGLIIN